MRLLLRVTAVVALAPGLAVASPMSSAHYRIAGSNLNGGGITAMTSTAPVPKVGGLGVSTGQAEALGFAGSLITLFSVAPGFWPIVGGEFCADVLDSDADLIAAYRDNCRFAFNPGQEDTAGILTAIPDGTGNACQCGDVDDDGDVDDFDVNRFRASLAAIPGSALTPGGTGKCSVIESAGPCDVLDVSVIERALDVPPLLPGIAQVCTAASQTLSGVEELHDEGFEVLARGSLSWLCSSRVTHTPTYLPGLNHQGLLLDQTGQRINGSANLTASRSGTHPTSTVLANLLYQENQERRLGRRRGLQRHAGAGTSPSGPFSASLFAAADTWLEVVVNGETMTPRQKLQAVAYSLQAQQCVNSSTLQGATLAQVVSQAQTNVPAASITGQIADAQVSATFTRDVEVLPLILTIDGAAQHSRRGYDRRAINSTAFTQHGTIANADISSAQPRSPARRSIPTSGSSERPDGRLDRECDTQSGH